MLRKTFSCLILTVVCVSFALGQKTENGKETIEKPCSLPPDVSSARTVAAQKELTQKILAQQTSEIGDDFSGQTAMLRKLLPATADAWAVRIVTTGGFHGQGLPTVTVVSNGDLFVAENNFSAAEQEFSTPRKKLGADVLQKINEIVRVENLSEKTKEAATQTNDASDSPQQEISFVCNDCYQTSITIARRGANGETEFFTNRTKNLLFSSGDFNRIQKIVADLIAAQN